MSSYISWQTKQNLRVICQHLQAYVTICTAKDWKGNSVQIYIYI